MLLVRTPVGAVSNRDVSVAEMAFWGRAEGGGGPAPHMTLHKPRGYYNLKCAVTMNSNHGARLWGRGGAPLASEKPPFRLEVRFLIAVWLSSVLRRPHPHQSAMQGSRFVPVPIPTRPARPGSAAMTGRSSGNFSDIQLKGHTQRHLYGHTYARPAAHPHPIPRLAGSDVQRALTARPLSRAPVYEYSGLQVPGFGYQVNHYHSTGLVIGKHKPHSGPMA